MKYYVTDIPGGGEPAPGRAKDSADAPDTARGGARKKRRRGV